jgi:hypothetical protein
MGQDTSVLRRITRECYCNSDNNVYATALAVHLDIWAKRNPDGDGWIPAERTDPDARPDLNTILEQIEQIREAKNA